MAWAYGRGLLRAYGWYVGSFRLEKSRVRLLAGLDVCVCLVSLKVLLVGYMKHCFGIPPCKRHMHSMAFTPNLPSGSRWPQVLYLSILSISSRMIVGGIRPGPWQMSRIAEQAPCPGHISMWMVPRYLLLFNVACQRREPVIRDDADCSW